MRIKSISGVLFAASAFLISSCISNDEPSQTQTEIVNNGITYTVDSSTGTTTKLSKASFKLETDYTNLSMGAVITSLSFPDGTVLPNAKFSDIKLTSNNTGWMIAEASSVRPEVEGFSSTAIPLFENVRIAAINHMADLNGQTVLGTERAVRLRSGNYTTYYTRTQAWSTGNTDVTENGNSDRFRSTNPIYLIGIDVEKQLASITIYNAVFAPAMENLGLTIRFRDIPFELIPNGAIRLARTEEFVPYIVEAGGTDMEKETPNPGFPISGLTCTWDLMSGINIAFDCAAKGSSYRVSANMPFNYSAKDK